MPPVPPLDQRIAVAIQTDDVRWLKGLLRESFEELRQLERLLLDVLAQNPDYRADGGLHARITTFLQQRSEQRSFPYIQ